MVSSADDSHSPKIDLYILFIKNIIVKIKFFVYFCPPKKKKINTFETKQLIVISYL